MRTKFLTPILVVAIAVVGTACLPNAAADALASPSGMVAAINADRNANGLGALTEDAQLSVVAQNWANRLAASGRLDHQDMNALGNSPYMLSWQSLTENLFYDAGMTTNRLVETTWMTSTDHRSSNLDPGVNRVGVGVAHDSAGGTVVVADFGFR